jgi:hypothetical protein
MFRGCAGIKEPGTGSGPEQLGRESECDGGGEGWVLIICVGKRGADTWVLQCVGHVDRTIKSERRSMSISGHEAFVSENAVYRCTKLISSPVQSTSEWKTHFVRSPDRHVRIPGIP